jgi:phosphatidylinositol phospholipase C, delta
VKIRCHVLALFSYLFYSQLSGDSNPEAYNRVLLAGGRAVELDCYDGKDGLPIVKHAFTLVKPCSFESIIRSMEPNLFRTSP